MPTAWSTPIVPHALPMVCRVKYTPSETVCPSRAMASASSARARSEASVIGNNRSTACTGWGTIASRSGSNPKMSWNPTSAGRPKVCANDAMTSGLLSRGSHFFELEGAIATSPLPA